jgi:hypothetical protein
MKEREVRLEHRLSFCGLVETKKVKAVNNEKVLKNISRDWEGASQLLTLITGIEIYIYNIHSKHLSQSSLTMNSKAAFPLDVNRRFLGESFFFLCSLHLAESKPFFSTLSSLKIFIDSDS